MSNDFFDPHFDCFPPSEPGEEVQLFYFLVNLFLLQPVFEVNELNGFTSEVVTEALFTYRVVLEMGQFVFGFDLLIVDDFQLVDILRFRSCGTVPDQVQKLVDVWYVFRYQRNVLLQRWRLQTPHLVWLRLGWFLSSLVGLFLDNFILFLSSWVFFLWVIEKSAFFPTSLLLSLMPWHLFHQSLRHSGLILSQNRFVLVKWTVKNHIFLRFSIRPFVTVKIYRRLRYPTNNFSI